MADATPIKIENGRIKRFLTTDKIPATNLPAGGGGGDMLSTNNLSDVADVATARINLGVPRVLKTDTTQTGNIGTGEDTLQTFSVPGVTLAINKETLTGTYSGTFATSINSKRLRLKFGATTIFDSGALAITTAASWTLEFEVIRTGAATQKCNTRLTTSSGTLSAYAQYSTAAETLSGAVTLLLTGEATADNDVVKEMFKLRWEPSE